MESPTTAGCMCKMGFLSGKTACFVGNVAVRNHRSRRRRQLGGDDAEGGCGEDGHRTVLEIIVCSAQPCTGVFVAGDSLAPTAIG